MFLKVTTIVSVILLQLITFHCVYLLTLQLLNSVVSAVWDTYPSKWKISVKSKGLEGKSVVYLGVPYVFVFFWIDGRQSRPLSVGISVGQMGRIGEPR